MKRRNFFKFAATAVIGLLGPKLSTAIGLQRPPPKQTVVGVGPGQRFKSIKEFQEWLNTRDLISSNEKIVCNIHTTEPQSCNLHFPSVKEGSTITLQPASGFAVSSVEST